MVGLADVGALDDRAPEVCARPLRAARTPAAPRTSSSRSAARRSRAAPLREPGRDQPRRPQSGGPTRSPSRTARARRRECEIVVPGGGSRSSTAPQSYPMYPAAPPGTAAVRTPARRRSRQKIARHVEARSPLTGVQSAAGAADLGDAALAPDHPRGIGRQERNSVRAVRPPGVAPVALSRNSSDREDRESAAHTSPGPAASPRLSTSGAGRRSLTALRVVPAARRAARWVSFTCSDFTSSGGVR